MRWPGAMFPAGLLVAAMVAAPGARADTVQRPLVPGVVNYVEGQAEIGNQALDAESMGTAQLHRGESLTTDQGRAEVLLTPGVFLRLDDNSAAEMVSPSLSRTQVALDHGQALVEVNEIHSENDLRVTMDGVTTHLVKTGLYDFDADRGLVRVVDGKAVVRDGQGGVNVTAGWQLDVNENGAPIPVRFDRKAFEATDLYRWSNLRSKYLAEANVDAARRYYAGGWYGPDWYGPGWYGSGWYWDPWLSAYTFVPNDGIFYNTFGWSYYSPRYAHRLTTYHHLGDRDFTGQRAYVPREHFGREGGGVQHHQMEQHEGRGRHR
jgi:hypothetical protein